MLIIENVNIHIPADSGRMVVELNEPYSWTNKKGKTWSFAAGWSTDGHSIPGPFKNFDRLTVAAMCHDLDCERATTYAQRRQGDKDYYSNMRDLGAPQTTAIRRYMAVSAYARYIKNSFTSQE